MTVGMYEVDVGVIIYDYQDVCLIIGCDVSYTLIAEDIGLVIAFYELVFGGI